uniref:SFRICE_004454 n=1 Tax=Spodoptera frugiperda TaxID=7108 RepID=A0A2H1VG99_SPOFR
MLLMNMSLKHGLKLVEFLVKQLRKPAPIRPLLAGDGTPRYRAEDRAELFADSLEASFQPNPARNVQHAAAIEEQVERYLEQPILPDEDPIVFSPGLVNGILRTGHCPAKWKLGRVAMVPVAGYKSTLLPGSYRPITLLDTVSKLFEKLLHRAHVPSHAANRRL